MLSASKKEQTSLGRCSTVRWKRGTEKRHLLDTLQCRNGGTSAEVFRPCSELPSTTLTAAQAGGLTGTPCKSLPSCFGQALASPSFEYFIGICHCKDQSAAPSTFLGGYFTPGLSGLAHSRFPWGILSQLTLQKAHLVSRRGCDLPEGLPGASSAGPGAHTRCLPRVWGAWPEPSLVSADLHQHLSIPPFLLLPSTPPAEPR